MRFLGCKIWESKEVALGEGSVTQYTLFEHKRLFSIIFYKWNTINQIRFHTHAFAAVAFLLKGWYWEKVRYNGIVMTNFVNVPLIPRFLPRNYCHAIENSKPGTMTMVITGPWQKTWWEFFPDTDRWVEYSWGRKKIQSVKNDEKTWEEKDEKNSN